MENVLEILNLVSSSVPLWAIVALGVLSIDFRGIFSSDGKLAKGAAGIRSFALFACAIAAGTILNFGGQHYFWLGLILAVTAYSVYKQVTRGDGYNSTPADGAFFAGMLLVPVAVVGSLVAKGHIVADKVSAATAYVDQLSVPTVLGEHSEEIQGIAFHCDISDDGHGHLWFVNHEGTREIQWIPKDETGAMLTLVEVNNALKRQANGEITHVLVEMTRTLDKVALDGAHTYRIKNLELLTK